MSFVIQTEKIGSMPNQAEGLINGRPFYFRARHGGWSLRVAKIGEDPVSHGEVIDHGEDKHAGWWEEDEARRFLISRLNIIERIV